MVAEHIANGMYGLILVEPEEGLPQVDHEFYVMQGEIYTDSPFGQHGSQEFSVEKLLGKHPEYFVFNGSVGALLRLHPLHAKVGDASGRAWTDIERDATVGVFLHLVDAVGR